MVESIAVKVAGRETLIRAAIVVRFCSLRLFGPAAEKTSCVCGAVPARETTRSILVDRTACRGAVGPTTVPGATVATGSSRTLPSSKPAAASAATAWSRLLPTTGGTARSDCDCGLRLPAASYCASVNVRVSPGVNGPIFVSYWRGPKVR